MTDSNDRYQIISQIMSREFLKLTIIPEYISNSINIIKNKNYLRNPKTLYLFSN